MSRRKRNRRIREPKAPEVNYYDYINSDEWREVRRKRIQADDKSKCAMCFSFGPTHIHHATYARLGHERLSDLVQLCPSCHELLHGHCKIGRSRKPSKVHKRLARKWLRYIQDNDILPIRKVHPEAFQALALAFFRNLLGASKEPLPEAKLTRLIATQGEDIVPEPKFKGLTPFQNRCLSFVKHGGAISGAGRSPDEKRDLESLVARRKLRFSNGMYSLSGDSHNPTALSISRLKKNQDHEETKETH